MKRLFTLSTIALAAMLGTSCSSSPESQVWQDFKNKDGEYLLPDFSYAGYMCGEVEIPAVETLGYKTFDITDFGAVANDGKSDRAAFIDCVAAVEANGGGIIYIPEGVFDVHAEGDPDETIYIRSEKTIIKGAGRDKSTILVSAANHPADPKKLWTSPTVIVFGTTEREQYITDVVADSPRGAFSVEVASAENIKAGDWINLKLKNNDPALVKQELGEYYDDIKPQAGIKKSGVNVDDFHQVKSVNGNTITFYEPIIYAVESKWGWKINTYPHLDGIGVEDITFEGDCLPDYVHHRTWNDDGGYKPLSISRATDSWVRRVNFRSVSECVSLTTSARISAFDIKIDGKRGHSAIRSHNSCRAFIGKVIDTADAHNLKGAGQWHAVGVQSYSLGAVLWRNEWGLDANFESHASQPRATLFDACKGGFLRLRQGGAEMSLPNHLRDLIIWNFEATATEPERPWQWWDSETIWTRFMPAVVVGFHGKELIFEPSQMQIEESH